MIAHLDADCFYASAERVRYAHLQGVPVGVLGNQGACVIAKSYEMKARGVSTGMPIWDALKVCPEGVYVKRDFHWYEVLSRAMLAIVRERSPLVEYYSIDEFFFDAARLDDPHIIQADILKRVGVPISIGVAATRTLAKLASDASKPFGCRVLRDDAESWAYVDALPITEVTGIARRSAVKLAAVAITTVGDFRRADRRLIRRLLTVKGETLWYELNGDPVTPIANARPMHKALARGGSVGQATADPDRIQGWLLRNLERLVEALTSNRYACGRLTLELSYKHGGGAARTQKLFRQTESSDDLLPAALLALSCWNGVSRVSHMHLIADQLTAGDRQRSLFDNSTSKLDRLKASVNDKLGRFALRSGSTLHLPDLYTDSAHNYDICDVQGKTCF